MTWSYRAMTLALIFAVCSVPAAAQKVAFVRGNTLLQSAPGIAERRALLDRESAYFRAEAQKMADSLQKMDKAYKDAEPTLSPAARDARQKVMNDQLEKFRKSSDSLQEVAAKRQDEVLQPIIDAVNRILETARTEDGYAAIWNIDETQGIVAFDKNLDITDALLAKVKKITPPPTPPTIIPAGKKVPPSPEPAAG